MHVSAWPRWAGRPRLRQAVSFEIEVGAKGKRAREQRLIQLLLRHKSAKPAFRLVFWATVVLNVAGLIVLASPLRRFIPLG